MRAHVSIVLSIARLAILPQYKSLLFDLFQVFAWIESSYKSEFLLRTAMEIDIIVIIKRYFNKHACSFRAFHILPQIPQMNAMTVYICGNF